MCLSKGAEGARGETELHSTDALGLQVDFECPAGGDIGMAAGITGGGSASGQLAYSAHKIQVEQLQKSEYHTCVALASSPAFISDS